MKTRSTLLIGLCLALPAMASEQAPEARTEEYCIVTAHPLVAGMFQVDVDLGDPVAAYPPKEQATKARYVNSYVAVLNVMNADGWEFAAIVPGASNPTFLMKRKPGHG